MLFSIGSAGSFSAAETAGKTALMLPSFPFESLRVPELLALNSFELNRSIERMFRVVLAAPDPAPSQRGVHKRPISGLLTNRSLWLGASARALPFGLGLPLPRPLGVYEQAAASAGSISGTHS